MTHCDVFVAGLGAMGGAIARACARGGLQVICCDAFQPPHEHGSSHGESRIIRAAYFEGAYYAPMARRALHLWRELERETQRSLLRTTGGVNIGPADGMLVQGALKTAREHDIAHELLDAGETMRRFPGFRLRPDDVTVFEPAAGILHPEACVAAQLESASAAGAQLHFNEPLRSYTREDDGIIVETTGGRFHARKLVLATGAWLPELVPAWTLTVTRQPVFWFEPSRPELYQPEVLPHFLIEFEPYRMLYGFPDLGHGVKCAIHYEGKPVLPNEVERGLRNDDVQAVVPHLRDFLPYAAGPLVRHSVCLYTNTPSGDFAIDHYQDLCTVSACSGHGFKFAPTIGEMVTESLLDQSLIPEIFYPKG